MNRLRQILESSSLAGLIDSAGRLNPAGLLAASTVGRSVMADGFFDLPTLVAKSASGQALVLKTATITSAAAATAVSLLADSQVPSGKKCYLMDFHAKVNGATQWATTATVKIQDTNGTPVDFVTMAVAALTANAFVGKFTANVTPEAALVAGTGGTAAKGLQLKGDANGTGSNLIVTALILVA